MIKEMGILFVSSLLMTFVIIYLAMILLQQQSFLKNKKFWICIFALGIYILLSYLITLNAVKVILEFLTLIIGSWFILEFKRKYFIDIVITTFVILVMLLLIDIVFSVIWTNLFNLEMTMANSNSYIKFFITSCSCMTLALILYIRKLRNLFAKIINNTSKFERNYNRYIIFVIMLSVSMFSISIYLCLFDYSNTMILIVLFIMIVIYTIVVIFTIKESNNKNKIQTEYDILLTNLSEYENLLDIQRVSNHENKNQLLVIKGMITKKEDNVSEYIDSIIDTQYADNEVLIMKTNRIPSGGLRGLIYYKMLMMKDKKIDVTLDVDRSLRELNFSEIPIKTNQELCKIVGVFLDNAIQAVEKINNKTIEILISYLNDELIIKISNSYEGNIDLDKIDNKGYTTKGKGHGYGLSLVTHIIDGNSKFVNEREINKRLFSQIIKLKI